MNSLTSMPGRTLRRIMRVLLPCLFLLPPAGLMAAELVEFTRNDATPALELYDPDGRRHALKDYGGNVVMVNFWASWCHPCLQEIPEMMRLAEKLRDSAFTVLAVNVGENKNSLPGFTTRMREHMTILLDTDSTRFRQWKGVALPATFIVDKGGEIRYEAHGAVDWDSPGVIDTIRSLLDEHTDTDSS